MKTKEFQQKIWHFFVHNKRDLPWRDTTDPYKILLSEIMLQQTQADRVVNYYINFLNKFPNISSLAEAEIAELLKFWKGLGYNRRALYLKKSAQKIVSDFDGAVPESIEKLVTLPGVGLHTAGAIRAYAYDLPVVFIETNIRKTIIYFFFHNQEKVSDQEIAKKIEETLPKQNIREWYWALVDYGSLLGKSKTVTNDRGKGYVKQSKFEGSTRQLRSAILWQITNEPQTVESLVASLHKQASEINQQLLGLCQTGLVIQVDDKYSIA